MFGRRNYNPYGIIAPFKYVTWIDETKLCFKDIGDTKLEGLFVSKSSTYTPGMIWISENFEYVHYIDTYKYERKIQIADLVTIGAIDNDFKKKYYS